MSAETCVAMLASEVFTLLIAPPIEPVRSIKKKTSAISMLVPKLSVLGTCSPLYGSTTKKSVSGIVEVESSGSAPAAISPKSVTPSPSVSRFVGSVW